MTYIAVAGLAVAAYAWLILVLRISGKRSLSKLNAFDFSITVAFGSALATILTSENVGLFRGALVLAMLALLQYVLTKLSMWSSFVRRAVRSRPTLLALDGQSFGEAMRHERITKDEIAQAVRNHGYGRLDEVGAVILETDGSFSVVQKSDKGYTLLDDVRRMGDASGPEQGGADFKPLRQPKKSDRG